MPFFAYPFIHWWVASNNHPTLVVPKSSRVKLWDHTFCPRIPALLVLFCDSDQMAHIHWPSSVFSKTELKEWLCLTHRMGGKVKRVYLWWVSVVLEWPLPLFTVNETKAFVKPSHRCTGRQVRFKPTLISYIDSCPTYRPSPSSSSSLLLLLPFSLLFGSLLSLRNTSEAIIMVMTTEETWPSCQKE